MFCHCIKHTSVCFDKIKTCFWVAPTPHDIALKRMVHFPSITCSTCEIIGSLMSRHTHHNQVEKQFVRRYAEPGLYLYSELNRLSWLSVCAQLAVSWPTSHYKIFNRIQIWWLRDLVTQSSIHFLTFLAAWQGTLFCWHSSSPLNRRFLADGSITLFNTSQYQGEFTTLSTNWIRSGPLATKHLHIMSWRRRVFRAKF